MALYYRIYSDFGAWRGVLISASQIITYLTLNIQGVPKVWTGKGENTRVNVKNMH